MEPVPNLTVRPGPRGELPPAYRYTDRVIPSECVRLDRDIRPEMVCDCRGPCGAYCRCVRLSYDGPTSKAVYEDGRLSRAFPGDTVFECTSACACSPTCGNRRVAQGSSVRTELVPTRRCGWGLRAGEDISPGAFVLAYAGRLVSEEESNAAVNDTYIFEIDAPDENNNEGGNLCVDASEWGNAARFHSPMSPLLAAIIEVDYSRFINHSCEPNLVPVKVLWEHRDRRAATIALFAHRAIPKGQDLAFDYGEGFWAVKWSEFLCACGARDCRYSEATIDRFLQLHYEAQYGSP